MWRQRACVRWQQQGDNGDHDRMKVTTRLLLRLFDESLWCACCWFLHSCTCWMGISERNANCEAIFGEIYNRGYRCLSYVVNAKTTTNLCTPAKKTNSTWAEHEDSSFYVALAATRKTMGNLGRCRRPCSLAQRLKVLIFTREKNCQIGTWRTCETIQTAEWIR